MREKIKKYIEKLLLDQDIIGMEIIFSYALWLIPISKSTYESNEKRFKTLFKKVLIRSLKLKGIKHSEIKERNKEFINFESSFGKNDLHNSKVLFIDEVFQLLYDPIIDNMIKNLGMLTELEKKIIYFLFYRIYIALNDREKWSGYSHYAFNDEGEIYKINTEKWSREFNFIYQKELNKLDFFTNKYPYGKGIIQNYREQSVYYWEFFDILLKRGLGYYVPWITKSGQIFLHFKILSKIYRENRLIFPFLNDLPKLEIDIDVLNAKLEKIKDIQEAMETWETEEDFFSEIDAESEETTRYIPEWV